MNALKNLNLSDARLGLLDRIFPDLLVLVFGGDLGRF